MCRRNFSHLTISHGMSQINRRWDIGSRQHIVTFTFTLLDEGAAAQSPNGNYTVCIFRAPESYECMSVCLRDVIKDLQMISDNGIEVDDERFEVDSTLELTGNFWPLWNQITKLHSCMYMVYLPEKSKV